jgi:hypothetical protein
MTALTPIAYTMELELIFDKPCPNAPVSAGIRESIRTILYVGVGGLRLAEVGPSCAGRFPQRPQLESLLATAQIIEETLREGRVNELSFTDDDRAAVDNDFLASQMEEPASAEELATLRELLEVSSVAGYFLDDGGIFARTADGELISLQVPFGHLPTGEVVLVDEPLLTVRVIRGD